MRVSAVDAVVPWIIQDKEILFDKYISK